MTINDLFLQIDELKHENKNLTRELIELNKSYVLVVKSNQLYAQYIKELRKKLNIKERNEFNLTRLFNSYSK